MNLTVLIFIGIAAVAIILLLIIRNLKDKKEVVDQMKNDYRQRKAGDEDIDVDEKM